MTGLDTISGTYPLSGRVDGFELAQEVDGVPVEGLAGDELGIFNGTAHLEELMARIGHPPCETLLSPFMTLTGVDPLRVDAECIG